MRISEAKRLRLTRSLAEAHALADEVLARARAARARTAPKREASREKKRNEEEQNRRHRATVYAAVDRRSGGACEYAPADSPIICMNDATEHDHFWGRGKEEETRENVWHLCAFHHGHKTDWQPDRLRWLCAFRDHAFNHKFWGEVEKCDKAIALERAQHPRNVPSVPVRIVVKEGADG
jgi:hypothetical protein